ncbi:hypothetical protein FNW25_00425 [Flavobacterium franklandianum]|uniref:hypothetical protein n=1 Tax=Flavobacterium franklandianum TaxID=2594430 RepID=UPI001179B30A|nr:hypothetical protein [Flavobacterium franklandianum]TRX29998.1 hypothetical protein FNW25_00425 [Flavobacterium franklandianum]
MFHEAPLLGILKSHCPCCSLHSLLKKTRTKKPCFSKPGDAASIRAIETIPKEKRILIDNSYTEISGTFAAIYQDYKEDIIHALEEGLEN